jgi:hypothetical protein
MPTPEQQREYTRLSGMLQQICMRYMRELPAGTTSVRLTNKDRNVLVVAYDQNGKPIGTVSAENTSPAFTSDLKRYFANVTSPDPDGVTAIVANPMIVTLQRKGMTNEQLRAEMKVLVDVDGVLKPAKVIDATTLQKGGVVTITGWVVHIEPTGLPHTTTADKIYPRT